jgi:hypothetical protein
MDDLNLVAVDVDGAVQETAAAMHGDTRAGFLRKAGVAGAAVAGSGTLLGVLAPGASARGYGDGGWQHHPDWQYRHGAGRPPWAFGRGDIGILNFALALEYLEAAFYNEAAAAGQITDPATQAFLATTVRDENAHVAALQQALGSNAIASPTFNFQGIPENQAMFQQTAYVLENTGVHAYFGQINNIRLPAYLAAAGSIAIVEGRHAAVIGSIINDTPSGIAPNGPFDTGETAQQVLTAVAGTGFVTGGLPAT